MKYFDFTLPTPAENLACDEALLALCEEGRGGEVLRCWEPREPFVVVGYANRAAREVNLEACRARGIPVLRRCSGGGTVLQGTGCLNYSVILRIGEEGGAHHQDTKTQRNPVIGEIGFTEGNEGNEEEAANQSMRGETKNSTGSIGSTNVHVLSRNRRAVGTLVKGAVEIQGHTDLVVNNLKFSGNAQRRLRRALIFHGTFLLNFDFGLMEDILPLPSQQPEYRRGRAHAKFLTNLKLPAAEVKDAMRKVWGADEVLTDFPAEKVRELVVSKYSTERWNLKF